MLESISIKKRGLASEIECDQFSGKSELRNLDLAIQGHNICSFDDYLSSPSFGKTYQKNYIRL